jgi:hypothetical protein
MSLTSTRDGGSVKVAAAVQSAQGTPVGAWGASNLLRTLEAEAPSIRETVLEDREASGSSDAGRGVLTAQRISVHQKIAPTPDALTAFMRGFTSEDSQPFEGSTGGSKNYLSMIWDSGLEALRASDVLVTELEFASEGAGSLTLDVTGEGGDVDFLGPTISNLVFPATMLVFAHRESTLEDVTGSAFDLCALGVRVRLVRPALAAPGGSGLVPGLVLYQGLAFAEGSILTRLSDESEDYFSKKLAFDKVKFRFEWTDQNGNKITVEVNNATLEGTELPRVGADARLERYEIKFKARHDAVLGVAPYKVTFDT